VLRLPDASPRNISGFQLGLTDITITYYSPAVNGRKLWGGMVPYGRVWRAGANENTTIALEHSVKVNGNDLPAGTYGIHMIQVRQNGRSHSLKISPRGVVSVMTKKKTPFE
jgi:hypothetical protein